MVEARVRVLTSVVPGLRETCNIGHDDRSLEKDEVELELLTTFIVHFYHQALTPTMLKVQHRALIEAEGE